MKFHTLNQKISWSLVIPTYMRDHILPRCIKLAIAQSCPPKEIVIIDASPNWEDTKATIEKLMESVPGIPLIYEKAIVASSCAQRNQGIKRASGDILFLIDDDSLMYKDCAERIMEVYAADVDQKVLGACALHESSPPDAEISSGHTPVNFHVAKHPKQTPLRKFFKKLLNTHTTQFLPYDGGFPQHPMPEALKIFDIAPIPYMTGSTMTFRRSVFNEFEFNELFKRYAAGEDQDLSYRVSRKGLIVNVMPARLCHLEVSGGRLSPYKVALLAALNPAVLQQFHAKDLALINKRWKTILWRLSFINFLKELSSKDLSLPTTRAVLYALYKLPQIRKRSGNELVSWYNQFQSDLLSQ